MKSIFKALNDETRRQILDLLKSEDMTAGNIADHFSISKPSISHHLDLLYQADLVSKVKNGQYVIYTLNTTVLEDVMSWIYSLKQTKTYERK